MDLKPIHSQKVAGFLMMKGFVLKQLSEDYNKSNENNCKKRNVFLFNDTEELRKAIDEFDGFYEKNRDSLYRKM